MSDRYRATAKQSFAKLVCRDRPLSKNRLGEWRKLNPKLEFSVLNRNYQKEHRLKEIIRNQRRTEESRDSLNNTIYSQKRILNRSQSPHVMLDSFYREAEAIPISISSKKLFNFDRKNLLLKRDLTSGIKLRRGGDLFKSSEGIDQSLDAHIQQKKYNFFGNGINNLKMGSFEDNFDKIISRSMGIDRDIYPRGISKLMISPRQLTQVSETKPTDAYFFACYENEAKKYRSKYNSKRSRAPLFKIRSKKTKKESKEEITAWENDGEMINEDLHLYPSDFC